MISAIHILLTLLAIASIPYYVLCLVAAKRFFSKEEGPPPPETPPVSILIPLCGVDFKAIENYASFCRQNYPSFQIVFGVQDPEDSSIVVVERLKELFPDSDIELVIGLEIIGQNPKVNNLHHMLQHARHDLLVLVDSDIRVEPDYLSQIIPPLLDDRVGLVTTLYRAGEAPNAAAKLEAVGITAEFAPSVLVAAMTEGISFAFGATIAMSRKKLVAIGGFHAVADYLADDFMLGHLVHRAGFEVRLSKTFVETVLPKMTFTGMFKHQLRWARGIRACRPWGHLGSIVTHGTALALVGLLFSGGSPLNLTLLAIVLLLRLAMAWKVGGCLLRDGILKRNLWLLPFRDLLSFAIWALSMAGKQVEWRGKPYRIVEDGKLVRL